MTSVVTFYRFVSLDDLECLRNRIEEQARNRHIKGTVLIAPEGINATLSGDRCALEAFADWLGGLPPFADLRFRYSNAADDNGVFFRLKVRTRREIVNLGQPDAAPAERTGVHVTADHFNELLVDPQVLVIDTRNSYEIAVGGFPGAVNPGTRSFREFPEYVRRNLSPQEHPRVAMFCTGGIRCEKASAHLLNVGFAEVYQLEGGILDYLRAPPRDNLWRGECFVFDQRVSVDGELKQGTFVMCYACRRALDPQALASADYVPGVSCPHCIAEQDNRQRAGFAERARQVELAAARGESHLGGPDSSA